MNILKPTGKLLASGVTTIYEHGSNHVLRFTPLKEVIDNLGEKLPAQTERYMEQKIAEATTVFKELSHFTRWNIPNFTYLSPVKLDGACGFACISERIYGESLFVMDDNSWRDIPEASMIDLIQGYSSYITEKYATLSGPLWNDVSIKQFMFGKSRFVQNTHKLLYMVDVDPIVFCPFSRLDIYDAIARLQKLVGIITQYYNKEVGKSLEKYLRELPQLPSEYSLTTRDLKRFNFV